MKIEFTGFVKKYKNILSMINNFLQRRKWARLFLLSIAIAALVFLLLKYLDLVAFLGDRISQEGVRLDYIKGFLWAIFLGLTISIWPVRSQDKKAIVWIWAVKCFVMLFLMLFYEHHYETDAFGYFHQAGIKLTSWKAMFIGEVRPNIPVTIITKLHHFSFLNSFHATKVSFGMIGLLAIYIFYRGVVVFLRQEKPVLLYIFAFFPSILFWSSVIGKDPIVLFGVAVYCYGVIKWIRTGRLSSLIVMWLGIGIGVFIRSWLGLILGLPIFLVTFKAIKKKLVSKIVVSLLLIVTILFSVNKVMMTFGFKSFNELTRIANQRFVGFNRGGSMVEVESPIAKPEKVNLTVSEVNTGDNSNIRQARYSSFKDMIIFLPKGIFTVLFRPLPGDVKNAFGFLAGLEGAFLLILFVFAVKSLRWHKLLDPVVVWAILLVGIWASLYAFISYNLGTICRYRLQILPVFLGLLLYLAYGGDTQAILKDRRRR